MYRVCFKYFISGAIIIIIIIIIIKQLLSCHSVVKTVLYQICLFDFQ